MMSLFGLESRVCFRGFGGRRLSEKEEGGRIPVIKRISGGVKGWELILKLHWDSCLGGKRKISVLYIYIYIERERFQS